jgi:hypothetical protein
MGWWRLTTMSVDVHELSEAERERIADLVRQGYTEGELREADNAGGGEDG